MASSPNTLSNIAGNFKVKYAKKLLNVVPMLCLLQQYDPNSETEQRKNPAIKVAWTELEALGSTFQVPVKVQSGHGISYNGSAGALVALQDALNLIVVQMQIIGYEMVNRQQMTYATAYAGNVAGDKAFMSSIGLMMQDLKDVLYVHNEGGALFGQNAGTGTLGTGFGAIESSAIVGNAGVTTGGTITFTPASFMAGWWPSMIGARIETFTGTTFSTGLSQGTDYCVVTAVNIATRTISVNATAAFNNTGVIPAVGDIVFMKGALTTGGTWNEQVGLATQLYATSGTIFGQNRATYALLQGNSFPCGSARLTKAKVTQAAMLPINKGNLQDMTLIVSTNTWADLAAEDLAQKIFDQSYSPATSQSGSRELKYEVLNKSIRVVCHPYMQGGIAFLTTEDHLSWIGSTDVTFRVPGYEQLIVQIPGYNGVEAQAASVKQIFHEAPSMACVITGIVNSS